MKKLYLLFFILINFSLYSQIPYVFDSKNTFSAERVAKFGTVDVNKDFLEITNSTQYDQSFIPSIWAHQQSDNRFVLRLFATTSSNRDVGQIPLMIFRTELRNNLNLNAPSGSTFPWGTTKSNVQIRPLFGWENGNTQLMRILSNGNVGIGVTDPTARLHTTGEIRLENLPSSNHLPFLIGSDNNGYIFKYDTTNFEKGDSDKDWLQIDDSTPNAINNTIYTMGEVGINVKVPTANLHTNGSLRFENLQLTSNPKYILSSDEQGNIFKSPSPTTMQNIIADQDWLKYDNTSSESIEDNIYTNGKVGINTASFPTSIGDEDISFYNLYVTGGILTEELRIAEVKDWPDYVFNKAYDLPSIDEVEKFISKNGHLINMPSEKETKRDGIELGKMNKLLLEKIEELTLYIIELNKKIVHQQDQIDNLNSAK